MKSWISENKRLVAIGMTPVAFFAVFILILITNPGSDSSNIVIAGEITDVRYFAEKYESRSQIILENGQSFVCRGYVDLRIGQSYEISLYKRSSHHEVWDITEIIEIEE